jgi:hypothetical protein
MDTDREDGLIKNNVRRLKDGLSRRLLRAKKQLTTCEAEILISQCVHYGAFRYGCGDYNPYEAYLRDLRQRVPIQIARQRFIAFLMHYRPTHLAEALGTTKLTRQYPLLTFPWNRGAVERSRGFCLSPDLCPDLLTHFNSDGISSFRIEEEFVWLERALDSIATEGYQPKDYTFVETVKFTRQDGQTAYLVLNGNHRISALAALEYKTVKVTYKTREVVREDNIENWPRVSSGLFTLEDALLVFQAYFAGNHNYHTTSAPAPILAHEAWKKLYFS